MSGDTLAQFVIEISGDANNLTAAINAVDKDLKKLKDKSEAKPKDKKKTTFLGAMLENDRTGISSTLKGIGSMTTGAWLLTAAFASLGLMAAAASRTMQYSKEVYDVRQLASAVNLTTRELTAMSAAAEAFNVDKSELLGFVNQLEAARANFKLGIDMGMFKDLGLMQADIDAIVNAKDAQEALYRLANSLQGMDKNKRLYIQSTLGLSPAMLDFLSQGGGALRDTTGDFFSLRPRLDETQKAVKEFTKAWVELKETMKGSLLDPFMESSLSFFTTVFTKLSDFMQFVDKLLSKGDLGKSVLDSIANGYTNAHAYKYYGGSPVLFTPGSVAIKPSELDPTAKEAIDAYKYYNTSSPFAPVPQTTVNVYVDGKQVRANTVEVVRSASDVVKQNSTSSEVR